MTSDADRYNCGYIGINEVDCRLRGCCYNKNINGGVCYRKYHCRVPSSQVEECGWGGIEPDQCAARGCCDNSFLHDGEWNRHTKWCIQRGWLRTVMPLIPYPDIKWNNSNKSEYGSLCVRNIFLNNTNYAIAMDILKTVLSITLY